MNKLLCKTKNIWIKKILTLNKKAVSKWETALNIGKGQG